MQAVIPNVAPNQNSKEGGDSRPFLPFFTGPAGVAPTPSQEDLRAVFSFFFFAFCSSAEARNAYLLTFFSYLFHPP